ncbi:MAG: AAA family ATPase [Blastocatellia bacterium]
MSEKEQFDDELEDDDEFFDDEAEAGERYPFLFDDEAGGDEPDLGQGEVQVPVPVETRGNSDEKSEHDGPNYHYLSSLSDELLPGLDFYRFDNLFSAKPARAFFDNEPSTDMHERLFANYWRVGEIAILFADTGTGKSLLAVQIAQAIASGSAFKPFEVDAPAQRVVYFDLELSDSQFDRRYSSNDKAFPAKFPFHVNFIRCPPREIDELPHGFHDYTAFLTTSIVEFIEFSGAKVVIIDNITWLNNSSQIGNSAARVMKALHRLKKRLGLSILVLAHTPKRFLHSAMTINDLQGSKMLANFADSIFAMGTSRRGTDIRYLKAVKHRSTAARGSETEVATIRLGKDQCFLGFTFEGYVDEGEHTARLKGEPDAERLALIKLAVELAEKGLTQRQIAKDLGVSAATVNRCLNALKE